MSSSHGRRPTSSSSTAAGGTPIEGSASGGRSGRPALARTSSAVSSTLPSTAAHAASATTPTIPGAGPGVPPPNAEFTEVVRCKAGMFEGKYMSFWLEVAQQPIHGRRKTDKDRRSIVPCPILRLWIREHQDTSSPGTLVDPHDIQVSNLVCHADLAPPNQEPGPSAPPGRYAQRPTESPALTGRQTPSPARARLSSIEEGFYTRSSSRSASPPPRWEPATIGLGIGGLPPDPSGGGLSGRGGGGGGGGGAESSVPESARQGASSSLTPIPRALSRMSPASHASRERETSSEESIATTARAGGLGSRPTSRGSDMSRGGPRRGGRSAPSGGETSRPTSGRRPALSERDQHLFGAPNIAGVRLQDLEGRTAIWFAFKEVCIRNEVVCSLHFRCSDITAADREAGTKAPTLAECRSADFRVYSPRTYPGRPATTPLEDCFARQGFKLNTRKNERQEASATASSPAARHRVSPAE